MVKKIYFLFFIAMCTVCVLEAAQPGDTRAMWYCPGTPPPQPARQDVTRFNHTHTPIGKENWRQDITARLTVLESYLPADSPAEADRIRIAYNYYFACVKDDCDRIEDFLKKMYGKEEVADLQKETAQNYLSAIVHHYEKLSTLTFEISSNMDPWQAALQDLIFDFKFIENLENETLDTKNNLEAFMQDFGLLLDDYDNGLI